jgi:nucleoside-diphosphate-sugar epimerase
MPRKTDKILTIAARKSSLKALVTGAARFIMSHLVEVLLQRARGQTALFDFIHNIEKVETGFKRELNANLAPGHA